MPSNIAVSIYIARGDDTLGPYTPGEAAELIKTGDLLPGDLAARDGDAAWVALSSFLPEEAAPGTPGTRRVGPAGRQFRRGRLIAIIFAGIVAALLASGVTRIVRLRTEVPPSQPPPRRSVASARPVPGVAAVKPAVDTPSPPPVNKKGVRLNGVIRLVSPDGIPTTLAAVQVRAYPLQKLVPYLEKKKAAVQTELDRLAPLIAAAGSEKNARVAAERSALQALLDAAPGSDLEPSLRFAHDQARAAVKDAENDCRYLLDQRAEVLKGEAYFRELPDAAATVNTNPESEFTLDLPPGDAFAVAASAQQAARTHYWLVKIFTGGEEQKTIVLSGDNETSSGSPESLILTAR